MGGLVAKAGIEAMGIAARLVGGQLHEFRLSRSAVFVRPGKHRRPQADAPSPGRDADALDLQPCCGAPGQSRDEGQLHRADELAVLAAHRDEELVRVGIDRSECVLVHGEVGRLPSGTERIVAQQRHDGSEIGRPRTLEDEGLAGHRDRRHGSIVPFRDPAGRPDG